MLPCLGVLDDLEPMAAGPYRDKVDNGTRTMMIWLLLMAHLPIGSHVTDRHMTVKALWNCIPTKSHIALGLNRKSFCPFLHFYFCSKLYRNFVIGLRPAILQGAADY